ncbi:methyltransferase family protein [Paraburkholderia sp. BL8N3]|nr:class I SAM-dependent methyltransferase [Paraburkholderia sp. BL8N3]TCK43963.1 methyltransferase family protein [Paraburkholderia sp. BL8N3]
MNHKFEPYLNVLGFYEAVPKPSAEELRDFYANKYYQMPKGTYTGDYPEEDLVWFRNTARAAAQTADRIRLDRSLLDLGCGEGFFTKAFMTFGWDVACCDFSEFGVATHNKELMPYFTVGDIYESINLYQSRSRVFGLINLQNVLEHVIDPEELLSKIKALMSEKSSLRIRVPNDYSDFQLALVDKGLTSSTWFTPPDHLSYFNNDGLAALLAHCGYKIHSLQADFPMEMFLVNPHANYWKDRTLGKGAHRARVFCENYLIERDVSAYVEYCEVAGKLGFGRNLIAYASPA